MPRIDTNRQPATDDYLESIGVRLRGATEARSRCPVHGGDARDSFAVNRKTGVWQCFSCAAKGGDAIALHMAIHGASFPDAAAALGCGPDGRDDPSPRRRSPPVAVVPEQDPEEVAQAERKLARAADLWRASRSIEVGTPAGSYLTGRGCLLPPADGDLRWLPDLHLFGFQGPALVGRISAALDASRGQGLHLTWIERRDSRWCRKDRRYLGAKGGGVVRLWPDEAVTYGLAAAEGLETALAAAHLQAPIWACMDAGNLAALPVLSGIDCLTIFADRDESGTGQAAAAACAQRWLEADREVTVLGSARIGADIADEVLR